MSTADALIAGLVGDAEFDSEGGFSLDREKAREKMRQFQLSDPHRYVLLLAEAAALRGASRIVFEIDSDDMVMQFDAGLRWADLDELYAALFVNRSSVEIRARRELALAFNAVMALNPRWVRIESVSVDAAGQALAISGSLRSDDADEIRRLDAAPEPPSGMQVPWTRIHVKERFRPGLLVRFINDLGGTIPEEQLIRTRCRYASLPVILDEIRVSEGLPSNLLARVAFEREHLRGVAGFSIDPDRRDRSAAVLLSNGVEICTHELSESVNGLWFWVDSSRFRKDVSQGDVVRSDPAYQDMLRAIAAARDEVLGSLAQMWTAGEFDNETKPTASAVFDLLRKCLLRWADESWLKSDAGALARTVVSMPMWRTVAGDWSSPLALVEQADPLRGIMYTERDFGGVMPCSWGPVIRVLDGQLELDAIARIYPSSESATTRLEREVPWELNRRRWLARPQAIELPGGTLRCPVSFEQQQHRGVAGLRPGRACSVQVVVEGCVLSEHEFELGGLGLAAVVTGPLRPAADHTAPRPDRSFATLLLLLAAQVPHLLEAWAREGAASEAVVQALLAVAEPEFLDRWLTIFGFTPGAGKQLLDRLGRPSLLPALGLEAEQQPSAIAALIEVSTVDRRRVSLAELAASRVRAREPGKLLVVDSHTHTVPQADEVIVHADEQTKRLLRAVFGAAVLHDETANYVAELGRRNFEARPQRSASPPLTTYVATVELELGEGDRIVGYVGVDASQVRDWRAERPRRASIEVFTRGRSLCTTEQQSWLPGVEAALDWAKAPLNAEWTGLDGSIRPLREAVEQGLLTLLRQQAETNERRPNDDVRRLLWQAITSPFVSIEHFRCWRALRAHHGSAHAAAVADFHAVIELFPGVPLVELREAMTLLIDDGKLPTRDNLLALMDRTIVPPGGGREFQRGLLELAPLLESVPMLELVSDRVASLADMLAVFDATGEVAYVEDRTLEFVDDEYVILRADEIDQVALVRLLGRGVFKEVSAWIHERRSQQRFEARVQIEQLRVPDRDRMVGFEFEIEGIRGELVIPTWAAGNDGRMRITYCHERRVIEEVQLHATMPVIGIIDDPHAVLSDDFSKVALDSPRIAAVRRVLDVVLSDRLLPALADCYEQLDERGKSLAWTWISKHWRKYSPRAGQHPERLSAAGRRFASLPLFADTDGTQRSLDELIERASEHRHLWYVERRPGHDVPAPFPILLPRAEQLETLAELFPGWRDFDERWRARVRGHQRKLAANDMPALAAPSEALCTLEVDRHGMQGVLWLPDRHPFGGGVVLGADGKIVEVQEPFDLLPALGLVGGELSADDLFEQVELSGPQRRYLESRVVSLYSSLLGSYELDLERPESIGLADPQRAERRALRLDVLRAAAISISRAELGGRSFDAILKNLVRRLCAVPLLRLSSGKLISVEVARRARPVELAHLGVWDPNEPLVDVSERARLLLGDAQADAPAQSAEPATSVEPITSVEPTTSVGASGPARESLELDSDSSIDDGQLSLLATALEQAVSPLAPPEPAPLPEPEPEPEPIGVLLGRICDELRVLRERHAVTLSEAQLGSIHAEPGRGRELVSIDERVIFDSSHPRFVRALRDPDPMWVSFLASVAYTALNRWLEEVTDDDEQDFHAAHASLLLTAMFEEGSSS